MTAVRDLTIVQGELFREQYTWVADGERQTLDGWRAVAHVRPHPNGDLIANLSPWISFVDDVVDDASGTTGQAIVLELPPNVTRSINRGGVWDLVLVDADGGESVRSKKLLMGAVTLERTVTQP